LIHKDKLKEKFLQSYRRAGKPRHALKIQAGSYVALRNTKHKSQGADKIPVRQNLNGRFKE